MEICLDYLETEKIWLHFISCVRKWDVYSRILPETQVTLDVLIKLLEDYRKLSMNDKLNSEHEIEKFVRSLDSFKEYGMCLIMKHRYIFSDTQPSKCVELGKYLM